MLAQLHIEMVKLTHSGHDGSEHELAIEVPA